jgi:hypothetical protein
MSANTRPDSISEIAVILARAFLRYRKSHRLHLPEPPHNGVASAPEPSVHVTVVNAERTDEN